MREIVGNFIFVGRSVVKNFLTTDFYIEYNRDLTNLDLVGHGFGDMGYGLVGECLQFVQQFWDTVWYN